MNLVLIPDFGKSDIIWIMKQSVVDELGQSSNLEADMLLKVADRIRSIQAYGVYTWKQEEKTNKTCMHICGHVTWRDLVNPVWLTSWPDYLLWLTKDVKADCFRERKINMKRKDKVGPKIKYDEMISMYMQGNVKPCGWNESRWKGEIMKIYQACMKIGLRADGSEQCLIEKDSGIRVYVSYYFLLFRYCFISKFDVP